MIFVGIDGVVADFELGFHRKYGCSTNNTSDDRLIDIKKRLAADELYLDLPIIEGSKKFIADLKQIDDVRFLSATGRYDFVEISTHQRIWCENNFKDIELINVPRSQDKSIYAKHGLLIDSRMSSIDHFRNEGGVACYFSGCYSTTIKEIQDFNDL